MAVRDVSLLLLGCALVLVAVTAVTCLFAQAPSRHLFVWNGDDDRADSDFMAVLDLIPSGNRYGRVVAGVPVGEKALRPPHRA